MGNRIGGALLVLVLLIAIFFSADIQSLSDTTMCSIDSFAPSDLGQKLKEVQSAGFFLWSENTIVFTDSRDIPQQYSYSGEAHGTVIDVNGTSRIYTVAHAFPTEEELIVRAFRRGLVRGVPVVQEVIRVARVAETRDTTKAVEAELISINRDTQLDLDLEDGFVLLKFPEQFSYKKPMKTMRTDCLVLGDQLWIVGGATRHNRSSTVNVIPYTVINIDDSDVFRVDRGFWHGFSGSGVVVFSHGEPRLIGLVIFAEGFSSGALFIPVQGIVYRTDSFIDYIEVKPR